MTLKRALVFGAGKIGRGFIGHLLHRAGHRLTFVDPARPLVDELNRKGAYPLFVLGAPEKDEVIGGIRAIALGDDAAVTRAVAEHSLFATAAGGANLESVGAALGRGLLARHRAGDTSPVNVIICENYKDPAAIVRRAVESQGVSDPAFVAWSRKSLGIAESQVLRSCIEPTDAQRAADALSIQVQDWWTLPCDADAFRGPVPEVPGLAPRRNFQNELIRKVYTYNCSNATISYLGFLRGHHMLHEAANDPDILAVAERVYDETGAALIAEFGFDPAEQKALQSLAISKYQDRRIADPIERNGRDAARKLSPTDRLVGPANLAIKHGGRPEALALAIAAAAHYTLSNDPGTQRVAAVLRNSGLTGVLAEFAHAGPDSTLAKLVLKAAPQLAKFNRINLPLHVK